LSVRYGAATCNTRGHAAGRLSQGAASSVRLWGCPHRVLFWTMEALIHWRYACAARGQRMTARTRWSRFPLALASPRTPENRPQLYTYRPSGWVKLPLRRGAPCARIGGAHRSHFLQGARARPSDAPPRPSCRLCANSVCRHRQRHATPQSDSGTHAAGPHELWRVVSLTGLPWASVEAGQ
jgi:hypothetical protein